MALNKKQIAAIEAINEAINASVEGFEGVLPTIQKKLLFQLKSALFSLKRSGDSIKNTAENTLLVQKITDDLAGGLITKQYIKALDDYIDTFNPILELNNKYFDLLNVNFVPNKARYLEISQSLIGATEFRLAQTGVWGTVLQEINQLLKTNVSSGGSYDAMIKTLITQVAGTPKTANTPKTLGYVEKYAKQIINDSVMVYNRQMQSTISADLKLEWYLYQGTLIRDSRPFCVARAGNYYHQKEIESWARQSWAGKYNGTNANTIFTYAGGYGCRHTITPVSKSVVPQSDIDRAKERGFI